MALCGLVIAAIAPLQAQFGTLSVNGDGSRVYFSTSMRLRGSEDLFSNKLFVMSGQGARLVLPREAVWTPDPPFGRSYSNHYQLHDPVVADDERQVFFTAVSECGGAGSGCIGLSSSRTESLAGGTERVIAPGRPRLSRNGRYVFVHNQDGFTPFSSTLIDLERGQVLCQSQMVSCLGEQWTAGLADDGSTLGIERIDPNDSNRGYRMFRRRLDGTRGPATEEPLYPFDADVSRDGTRAVYYTRDADSPRWSVYWLDLVSGTRRRLHEGSAPQGLQRRYVWILPNGRNAIFLQAVPGAEFGGAPALQPFLAPLSGVAAWQIMRIPSGVTDVGISGNSGIAFFATGEGGITRRELGTHDTTNWIERTPFITYGRSEWMGTRGSLVRMLGSGFSPGLVHLLLDGRPVPLISVQPTEIQWQLPWDANPGEMRLHQDGSLFEQGGVPFLATGVPMPNSYMQPLPSPPYWAWSAVRQDWSGIVSEANPARPGEVIHVYLRGLGEVTPSVETGSPGPASPQARITGTLECLVDELPVEVLFAGLAPGMIGVYQADVRLPDRVAGGAVAMRCRMGLQMTRPAVIWTSN